MVEFHSTILPYLAPGDRWFRHGRVDASITLLIWLNQMVALAETILVPWLLTDSKGAFMKKEGVS